MNKLHLYTGGRGGGGIKEGDIMDIYMWQSEAPNVLHFQIEVLSKVVSCVTIEYYAKEMCSKL